MDCSDFLPQSWKRNQWKIGKIAQNQIQVSGTDAYRVLSSGPNIVAGIPAYLVCCLSFLYCASRTSDVEESFVDLDGNDSYQVTTVLHTSSPVIVPLALSM